MAEFHDATEEYLEAILEIEEEGTVPIRARLVERLGLSAPAVSETVNRLVEHGYAELLDDRTLRLTPKGREVAVSIVRRHRLAERLARRRDRPRVGEGAPRGRPLGARDLGRRGSQARPAARRPGHLSARKPDPGVHPQGRGRPLHAALAVGTRPGGRPAHQREDRDRRRRPRVPRRGEAHPRIDARSWSRAAPTVCASRATPASSSSRRTSPS